MNSDSSYDIILILKMKIMILMKDIIVVNNTNCVPKSVACSAGNLMTEV